MELIIYKCVDMFLGVLIAALVGENVALKKKNQRLRKQINKLKRNLLDLQSSIKESVDEQVLKHNIFYEVVRVLIDLYLESVCAMLDFVSL
jgi:hypothetical protein